MSPGNRWWEMSTLIFLGNLRDVTKICIRSRSTNLMIKFKYFAIIVECFNGTVTYSDIWHNKAFINIWYYFIFKAVLHTLLYLIYINANDCTSLEISVTSIYTRLHTKPMSNWKSGTKNSKAYVIIPIYFAKISAGMIEASSFTHRFCIFFFLILLLILSIPVKL